MAGRSKITLTHVCVVFFDLFLAIEAIIAQIVDFNRFNDEGRRVVGGLGTGFVATSMVVLLGQNH